MKASDWIDRLMTERGWSSDYRVAKELDIAASSISKYRNKPESTMDDDTACKVATALNVKPEIVILDQVTERTKSEPARAALSGLLERLAPRNKGPLAGGGSAASAEKGRVDIRKLAAVAAVGVAALASAPQPVQAMPIQFDPNTHRINRRRRNSGNSHSSTWQQLQAAFESIASYVFPLSPT